MTTKGGAPRGNQNARKHGLYSKVLDQVGKQDFERAVAAEGIDEEIALMRVTIKTLLERDPGNIALVWRGVEILGRLTVAKSRFPQSNVSELSQAVYNVLAGPDLQMYRDTYMRDHPELAAMEDSPYPQAGTASDMPAAYGSELPKDRGSPIS